jgi:4-amino-4-deoxy-L-arabinose transferase-like glycosyltransferase
MLNKIRNNPQFIYLTGVIFLVFALLINLGKLNIFMAVDEATRALVALEMMIRDNYIVSTINGEIYLNKPPLFPWILTVFYKLFGINEFVLRLPTVISLLGFGLTVYWFVSRELGKQAGIIAAFTIVTSGRLLFWESLLGYIDITFSWVVYASLMFIFYYFRQKKFLHLFIVSYLLMTVGFMLKGLPAIVFQGIAILVVFISEGEFRKLFSWQHFMGGLIFIMLAGSYYLFYNQYHPLEDVFARLWSESVQRTVGEQGFLRTLKHLLFFPFEMLYHYLPWTLFIIFAFVPGFWKTIFSNKFLKYNMLVAGFNIIPYWVSPDVYPKYIMMLIPMFFTVFIFFYLKFRAAHKRLSIALEWVFIVASTIISTGYLTIPFLPQFSSLHGVVWKSLVLFCLSVFFTVLVWKIKKQRIVLFAIILIIARVAFGLFIWPQRAPEFDRYEKDAKEVALITAGEEVYYYHAEMSQYAASYIMTREKWDIIRMEKQSPKNNIFYITDDAGFDLIRSNHDSIDVYFSYPNIEDGRNLNLIKLRD